MPFPTQIAEAAEVSYSFGFLASTIECTGAKYHSPAPLIVQEYVLDPEWGMVTIGVEETYFGQLLTAWMCGTCADNVALYLQLMKKHGGDPAWPVRREFGNLTRLLGDRAWEQYQTWKKKEDRCCEQ